MDQKTINNMRINRVTFLVCGVLFSFLGFFMPVLLVVAVLLLFFAYKANKAYKKAVQKTAKLQEKNSNDVVCVTPDTVHMCKRDNIIVTKDELREPDLITEEEFNRLKNMCCDIHKEYKELLKGYKDADTDGKVYILKECYRKLNVIENTVHKYKCYYDIDTYDELEKIEKKAKTFISTYINEQREAGYDDYLIDVKQFSDTLDFIYDYIYEKEEKLNK